VTGRTAEENRVEKGILGYCSPAIAVDSGRLTLVGQEHLTRTEAGGDPFHLGEDGRSPRRHCAPVRPTRQLGQVAIDRAFRGLWSPRERGGSAEIGAKEPLMARHPRSGLDLSPAAIDE
jgi:hypothetical protein